MLSAFLKRDNQGSRSCRTASVLCWLLAASAATALRPTQLGLRPSHDNGVHHLQFSGVPRSAGEAEQVDVHMFLKCQIQETPVPGDGTTVHFRGFFFAVRQSNPSWTPRKPVKLMSPDRLKGWQPQVNISIARGSFTHGYSDPSSHLTLSVMTATGFDNFHQGGGETIPTVLLGVAHNVTETDSMRVYFDGWPGFHLFSAQLCVSYDPAKVSSQTKVVVATKAAHNTDVYRLARILSMRTAYFTCFGFHQLLMYAYRDQVIPLITHKTLQRYMDDEVLSINEWPLMMFQKLNSTSQVSGVAWDKLFYMHAGLRMWNFTQRVMVLGLDLDELVVTDAGKPFTNAAWDRFFDKYPESVLTLHSSGCPEAQEAPHFGRCQQIYAPQHFHHKAFLDALRVEQTGSSHSGTGTNATQRDVDVNDMFFVHLNHKPMSLKPWNGKNHLWVLDTQCFKSKSRTALRETGEPLLARRQRWL